MKYIPDSSCPECGSRVYRDTVEVCTHADHEGEPVYEMVSGIWCVNEKCQHSTQGLDEEDLVQPIFFPRFIYGKKCKAERQKAEA